MIVSKTSISTFNTLVAPWLWLNNRVLANVDEPLKSPQQVTSPELLLWSVILCHVLVAWFRWTELSFSFFLGTWLAAPGAQKVKTAWEAAKV